MVPLRRNYVVPVRCAACCRNPESSSAMTTESITAPERCAEKMAFIVGMYCDGASGEATMQRMRGLARG